MLQTAKARPAAPGVCVRPFWRYAWAVLAYNVAVVLWGAYVRATGSGAGCGNHWPLCDGQVLPHSPSVAKLIEFTHRATSGIDLVLVAILVVWAWRAYPRGHGARAGAALSAVFLTSEALIGAMLVKLQHVARNASVYRAYSLSTHLVNTLTLLACLTLTIWWAAGHAPLRVRGKQAWLAAISLGVVVLLGISGAIAALGDTLFPAASVAAGLAQDLDASSNILLRLRALHPLIAMVAAVWVLLYALGRVRQRPRRAWLVVAVLVAQLVAGVLNLLLLAPVWMQLVHLLLADMTWIALVLLCAASLSEKSAAAA